MYVLEALIIIHSFRGKQIQNHIIIINIAFVCLLNAPFRNIAVAICPKQTNIPTSDRYWLEDGISAGGCRYRPDFSPTCVLCILSNFHERHL